LKQGLCQGMTVMPKMANKKNRASAPVTARIDRIAQPERLTQARTTAVMKRPSAL
jgi:hypothetical protein